MVIQGLSQTLTSENSRVFSVDGKQINIGILDNNTLDAGNLESGIYFLRIETKEGSAVVQFVKG